ncbi:MAG: GntR family transcriptional regulator [Gemmatimonadota bacterium]
MAAHPAPRPPTAPTSPRPVDREQDLTNRLRDRLLNALHVGRIRPGDRLASIREVARDTGADHRAVAAAYRVLQEEGLVEVRGRSGVYVAQQERLGGELLAETARWLAGVMTDAWRRQIPLGELHDLLRRCTQTRLRVACVESNVDQMTAYCAELQELFGLESHPVYLSAGGERPEDAVRLQAELARADLVVTTRFHAARVQRAALPAGKPVVVVTVHSQIVEAIRRELERGELVVVSADPEFGERIRAMHGASDAGNGARIRLVPAQDRESVEHISPDRTVLLTLAARTSLQGVRLPPAIPHSPTFSPQTARELAEAIIRLNLRAERLGVAAG